LSPVFFTDRDLGKQFPASLVAAGLKVERFADHFKNELCPDEVWLREVGRRGWIAITHDRRIRYKPNELAAVIEHRVGLLVVIGKAPFPELARSFIATRHRVEVFLQEHEPPFIAKVYRPSTSEIAQCARVGGALVSIATVTLRNLPEIPVRVRVRTQRIQTYYGSPHG
jgi:hypothetical protein